MELWHRGLSCAFLHLLRSVWFALKLTKNHKNKTIIVTNKLMAIRSHSNDIFAAHTCVVFTLCLRHSHITTYHSFVCDRLTTFVRFKCTFYNSKMAKSSSYCCSYFHVWLGYCYCYCCCSRLLLSLKTKQKKNNIRSFVCQLLFFSPQRNSQR